MKRNVDDFKCVLFIEIFGSGRIWYSCMLHDWIGYNKLLVIFMKKVCDL